jgi:TonB family protein
MKRPKHARFLNAISIAVGVGVTLCLFLSIAHFLRRQEKVAPRVQEDDLDWVAVAMPPPPPPPKKTEEKPSSDPEMADAVALGFQEEASTSPVKIEPSPPSSEELLPMSLTPSHVVSGSIGIDFSLKPKIDVTFDSNHVFQKSEVDKPPFVISRPGISVPNYLERDHPELSVVVVFVVDTHGVVGNLHILRPSDSPAFDSISADYIREWLFSPAIKKGRPVRCMTQQRLRVQWGHSDPFSL